jgi:hypothetical protein
MKYSIFFILFLLLLYSNSVKAQVFQFGINASSNMLSGDFTSTDINSETSGFATYGYGGNLDFKFYAQKFGFGARVNYNFYERDRYAYEVAIRKKLGIVDDKYFVRDIGLMMDYGFQLSFSYKIPVKGVFNIEPYIYLGFNVLATPPNEVIYNKSSLTYTYQTQLMGYIGYSFSPGVKFQWDIGKHFGLNLYFEYSGTSYESDAQRIINYSSTTFESSYRVKSYNINAVNFGMGLNFYFGKGLEK